MALGMLKIKNCQIAAWTAWLEAYMSSDETPTFVNCQRKYILINDNWYSSIVLNSVIRTNGADLIWIYYKILFIIQFWQLILPIKLYIVPYFLDWPVGQVS
jgi:hypothetical protein